MSFLWKSAAINIYRSALRSEDENSSFYLLIWYNKGEMICFLYYESPLLQSFNLQIVVIRCSMV